MAATDIPRWLRPMDVEEIREEVASAKAAIYAVRMFEEQKRTPHNAEDNVSLDFQYLSR